MKGSPHLGLDEVMSAADVERHLKGIGDTVTQVFERARSEGLPTGQVADLIAESRFRRA